MTKEKKKRLEVIPHISGDTIQVLLRLYKIKVKFSTRKMVYQQTLGERIRMATRITKVTRTEIEHEFVCNCAEQGESYLKYDPNEGKYYGAGNCKCNHICACLAMDLHEARRKGEFPETPVHTHQSRLDQFLS